MAPRRRKERACGGLFKRFGERRRIGRGFPPPAGSCPRKSPDSRDRWRRDILFRNASDKDKYPDIPYKHTGHFLQWEPFAVESARNAECGTRSPESDPYPLR